MGVTTPPPPPQPPFKSSCQNSSYGRELGLKIGRCTHPTPHPTFSHSQTPNRGRKKKKSSNPLNLAHPAVTPLVPARRSAKEAAAAAATPPSRKIKGEPYLLLVLMVIRRRPSHSTKGGKRLLKSSPIPFPSPPFPLFSLGEKNPSFLPPFCFQPGFLVFKKRRRKKERERKGGGRLTSFPRERNVYFPSIAA